jgi:hypothetical protein
MFWVPLVAAFVAASTLVSAQAPTVITTGLQSPQRLLLTPRGNFLVTESGAAVNAGRVSFISRSGNRRSLIEGLPAGADVEGGFSGPTAVALQDRTVFVAIGPGDAERRGTVPGTSQYNPAGFSSPLFASILAFRFSSPVDNVTGTVALTPAQHQQLADGQELMLRDGAGGTATASLVVKLPEATPDPNAVYRFSNPYGFEFSRSGRSLYYADASQDTVVEIDLVTSRRRTLARFPKFPNPSKIGPPVVDAVPTSVTFYDSHLLVTFLTGYPFTPGNARVYSVDLATKKVEPFINGLSSAVDLQVRRGREGAPEFFVLEFSTNQSATPPAPGRLLHYVTPAPMVLSNQLTAPISIQVDNESNTVFVLELTGRLLAIKL